MGIGRGIDREIDERGTPGKEAKREKPNSGEVLSQIETDTKPDAKYLWRVPGRGIQRKPIGGGHGTRC